MCDGGGGGGETLLSKCLYSLWWTDRYRHINCSHPHLKSCELLHLVENCKIIGISEIDECDCQFADIITYSLRFCQLMEIQCDEISKLLFARIVKCHHYIFSIHRMGNGVERCGLATKLAVPALPSVRCTINQICEINRWIDEWMGSFPPFSFVCYPFLCISFPSGNQQTGMWSMRQRNFPPSQHFSQMHFIKLWPSTLAASILFVLIKCCTAGCDSRDGASNGETEREQNVRLHINLILYCLSTEKCCFIFSLGSQ